MTALGRTHPGEPSVAVLDAAAFERVARIALATAGLCIPDSKRTMVQSRLARRLKVTGYASFDRYLDHVEQTGGAAELEQMVSALTTNVSHFFREDHHFTTLRERVLGDLLTRARQGGRVRFWSAGCSTGQEPYTLAMSLLEAESRIDDLDMRILATDIDLKVLAAAKAGRYDERQIQSVPDALRSRYFSRVDRDGEPCFAVSERLRRIIRFRQLNLMAPWPMRGTFDAIFCRNVVIYFSEATQATLWPRFHAALAPGGWLFLGHSERIHDPSRVGFDTVGVTTYRRQAGSADSAKL